MERHVLHSVNTYEGDSLDHWCFDEPKFVAVDRYRHGPYHLLYWNGRQSQEDNGRCGTNVCVADGLDGVDRPTDSTQRKSGRAIFCGKRTRLAQPIESLA